MRVYICPKNERIEQQEQIFFVAKNESLMHKYTAKLLNSKINGNPVQEIS